MKRSQDNTGRLARKGEKVIADERTQVVERKLAEARAERDALLASENKAFSKGVETLEQTRGENRKRIRDDFEKQRDAILKKFAEEQQAA